MTGYARGEADFADRYRRDAHKDYSVPLHVDCSIEYELPDCAKPPQGVKIEPLLMIHPSHFRRLESLRRVPFVNNLPKDDSSVAAVAAVAPSRARASRARRCCRPQAPVAAPPPEPCYRFEAFAAEGAHCGAERERRRLKAHPYLPEGLECDFAQHVHAPSHYERFDKRALHQLPIYM